MERGWEGAVGELGGEISGSKPLDGFTEGREKDLVRLEDFLTHSLAGCMDENGRRPSDLSRPVVRVLSKDISATERASALLVMACARLIFNRFDELGDVPPASCSVLVTPTR